MSDEQQPLSEDEIDAAVAAAAAQLDAAPKEYVIYPGISVVDGLIRVSPELIDALLQDYLFNPNRTGTHREGDIALWVKYEDLKNLIEKGGATVKEVDFSVEDILDILNKPDGQQL